MQHYNHVARSCTNKRRYETEAQARSNWNGGVYDCVYCNGWHRTSGGAIGKLVKAGREDSATHRKAQRIDRYNRRRSYRGDDDDDG